MLASALAGHSESGEDNDAWITTGYRYDYDCDMCHDDDGAGKAESDSEWRNVSFANRETLDPSLSDLGARKRRREEGEDESGMGSEVMGSGASLSLASSLGKRRKRDDAEGRTEATFSTRIGSFTGVKFSATQPASLRRGLSLRSEAESGEGGEAVLKEEVRVFGFVGCVFSFYAHRNRFRYRNIP
jgi:hypothetical protein